MKKLEEYLWLEGLNDFDKMIFTCTEPTISDIVFTVMILYILFIIDIAFTFINFYNLKKIYSKKKYLKYEYNLIIKYLINKYGLKKTTFIYPVLGLFLFTLFVLYFPIQPCIIIGFLLCLVITTHIPNYYFLRKKVKKKCQ